ncbi:MAG: SusC/RagA family TonB-linked outer membrane protein [Gemmatimonadetes bacterium]|nr:SusC/RagA family TonB-linked outer membrane protein [Gemmatimonadota bacterium]
MSLTVRRFVRTLPAVAAVLLGMAIASTAQAQSNAVSGVVTDGTNPIANALVAVDGRDGTVRTDARGRFRIDNATGSQVTVRVTFIGYRPLSQTIRVGDGNVQLVMTAAAINLDAIVVTGTAGGTATRAIGNVVETVDAARLMATMAGPTLQQVLGQRTPGLVVLPAPGAVGAGAPLRIRGTSSMSLSNDPLVFIDGIRMDSDPTSGPGGQRGGAGVSRLNDLNPDDIQSVEIIKGPSAATLYGTEASNGVIQIITKRGAQGRPRFDLSVRRGTNWMMNPEGRAGLLFMPDTTAVRLGLTSALGAPFGINLYEYERDNRSGAIFHNGTLQGYSGNLSGGTEGVRYFASLSYDHDVGIVAFNWDKRLNARLNLDLSLTDNLTARLSSGYIDRTTSLMQTGFDQDPFSNLVWGNPRTLFLPLQGWFQAPPSEWGKIETIGENNRSTTSIELRHKPLRWLSHRLATGLDVNDGAESTLYPRQPEGAAHFWTNQRGLGEKTVERETRRNLSVDYSVSAKYNPFRPNLGLTTSVGFQYYKREFSNTTATGRVFAALPLTTVSGGTTPLLARESFEENATVGGFVQQQVDWNNRVFLTGAVRMDDNSAFGAEYNAAVYPKVSASWVIHEEPFWPLPWVSQLKLRSAWGAAGQQPGTFDASRLYDAEIGYNELPALVPGAFGNPALKPERSEELEMGLDASLWSGRIEFNYTHYQRWVKDAIVNRPIPPSTGFSGSQIVNLGQVKGWGDELGVVGHVLTGRKLGIDLGVQFATNGTRIENLGGLDAIGAGGRQEHRPGFPIAGVFVKYVKEATIDAGGFVTSALCDGGTGPSGLEKGGALMDCNTAPRIYFGPGSPTWQLGFSTTFTLFQNLRLEFRVEGNGGYYNINTEMRATHNLGLSEKVLLRNDPLVQATRQFENDVMGLYDGSFARLREVSMTYTIPQGIVSRVGASRGSFTVSARNLWMLWTGEHGFNTRRDGRVAQVDDIGGLWTWDPEIRSSGNLSASFQTVLPPTASVVAVVRLGL